MHMNDCVPSYMPSATDCNIHEDVSLTNLICIYMCRSRINNINLQQRKPFAGLELNRFLAGACRAPRLKNLGARLRIPVPGYMSDIEINRFWPVPIGHRALKFPVPGAKSR